MYVLRVVEATIPLPDRTLPNSRWDRPCSGLFAASLQELVAEFGAKEDMLPAGVIASPASQAVEVSKLVAQRMPDKLWHSNCKVVVETGLCVFVW